MLLPLEEVFIPPNRNTPSQMSEKRVLPWNTTARAQTQTTRSAVQRANQKKYYETTFLQICSSNISEKKSTEDSHVNK